MPTTNAAHRTATAAGFGALFDGGTLDLLDVSQDIVATYTLGTPAFAAVPGVSGAVAALGLPQSQNAVIDTEAIAGAILYSTGDTYQITNLSVRQADAGGTANIVVDDLTPANGTAIRLLSLTITVGSTVT